MMPHKVINLEFNYKNFSNLNIKIKQVKRNLKYHFEHDLITIHQF